MKPSRRIAVVVGLVAVTTIAHYATDPTAGALHEFYARLYYLPVILGALWFGVRGGLLTALAIAIVYSPHAWHGWMGPHSLYYRLMEIAMYHVVGGVTGYLSSQANEALRAERLARRAREKAYESLREKTREILNLEEQLRRSDRLATIGSLSAGLAHEIRNPLGSIKTCVEILRDQRPPRDGQPADETVERRKGEGESEAPDLYGVLIEETDRLNHILTNFLDLAKTHEKGASDEVPYCRIDRALSKTLELFERQMAKRRSRVEYDPDALATWVAMPESGLRQVFLNLMLNSLDAMPDGGTVRVDAVDGPPETANFAVRDTGAGIPAEIASRVFDPFFSTKDSGAGLGLSIIERIVVTHGGRIDLVKDDAPGACFRIALPRHSNGE